MSAILHYKLQRSRRPCGTTIGADGCGEFFKVINGTDDACWEYAKALLSNLDKSYIISYSSFALDTDESYSGMVIETINL